MSAATLTQRRGNPLPAVLLAGVVLVIAAAVVLMAIRNQAHADSKHSEAALVRSTYKNGACAATEAYVWPAAGTVLILCQLKDTAGIPSNLWGGLTFRFIENGLALIDPSKGLPKILDGLDDPNGTVEAYEPTVMARERAYWDRVIARGYRPITDFPDVAARFFAWLSNNL